MEKSLLDILWILLSAVLVFLMQPGFMCLESGLTRSKNSISVAVKNLSDFAVSVFVFWVVGYGIMYGATGRGLAGTDRFLAGMDSEPYAAAFFLFQAMFCGTAATIFSGAVAERMRFNAYMSTALLLSAFIYPLFGHWAWNGLDAGLSLGWLGRRGFVDFAGSTVVHSVGGWVALAVLLVIGPRKGRFPEQGPPKEIHGSNLPFSLLGALLLWVGWFGFNGGSTLAMTDQVPVIIAHTTLAGAAGAITCLLWGWYASGVPKVAYIINGSLGGLVAVTANCHCVETLGAVLIGIIAGFVYLGAEWLLIRHRIDDAVGAIPVHLGCGVWGTLAVAFFGTPELVGTGLTFLGQLSVQAAGIAAAFGVAFVVPYLLFRGIDRIFPLRVSPEEEEIGLNVSEHGARTDLVDLFQAMDRQAEARDLSLRLPEEPFTEAGRIARRYNRVMGALETAVAQTDAIIRTAKDAVVAFGKENLSIIRANPSASEMFGYGPDAIQGLAVSRLFSDACRAGSGEAALVRTCSGAYTELTGRRSNGGTFPMEAIVTEATAGKRAFYVATFRDITERRRAKRAIERQRAYFEQLFEGSPQAIVMLDTRRRITAANRGYESLFGHPAERVIGRRNRDLVVPPDRMAEVEAFNQAVLNGQSIQKETYRRHATGRLIPVSLLGYPIRIDGEVAGIFFIYEDISERKAIEAQLHEKAFYDFLTGIPNRILFMERLERAVERAKRREEYAFALILLDLDRFKWVNDSLGHLAGDRLLMEVSARFTECVRAMDTVARLGGDEFAVLVEEFSSPKEVIRIAKRLQGAAQEPFSIDGHEVRISSSIGIVLKTRGYRDPQNILRDADIAMYRAKEMGKARSKVFNKKMHEFVFERLRIENDLREAIQGDQLVLFYQPIVAVGTRKLEGFEALVRWRHPADGLIGPGKFIPVAEETGLILPLGRWVLGEACRQLKEWQMEGEGTGHLKMSVNISARQFLQRDLGDFIVRTLERTGLPPCSLRIELTETVIMEHANTAVEQLRRLKSIGVQVAVDDFGTGYSSLSYLQRFPIDCLKIDRSFVEGLGLVEENTEIVKTIISLARNLGIGVVAEGVEEESQLARLDALCCDNAQGFFFSRPVDREGVPDLIARYL